jgi:hypothetical protein
VPDEARILRARLAELAARIDRLPEPSSASDVMVGQVYNGGAGIPTTLPNQFAVRPVTVGGPECEACTPTITPDTTRSAIVTVLGGKVPVAGDNLIARLVGDRWVARRIKAVAATTANCTICVSVTTCLTDLSGFMVNLTKGTLLNQTLTTGADGKVCFPITLSGVQSGGTYTWTASKAGYTTRTGTVNMPTATTCSGGAVFNATANMGDPIGFNCCASTAGYTCQGIPIPTTLYLSDGLGTVTLNYQVGTCTWLGCAMRTANESADGSCSLLGPADVPIQFLLQANPTTWVLQLSITGCGYAYVAGGGAYNRTLATRGLTCASPISAIGGTLLNAVPAGCGPFSWSQSKSINDWHTNPSSSDTEAPILAIYGNTISCSISS